MIRYNRFFGGLSIQFVYSGTAIYLEKIRMGKA